MKVPSVWQVQPPLVPRTQVIVPPETLALAWLARTALMTGVVALQLTDGLVPLSRSDEALVSTQLVVPPPNVVRPLLRQSSTATFRSPASPMARVTCERIT